MNLQNVLKIYKPTWAIFEKNLTQVVDSLRKFVKVSKKNFTKIWQIYEYQNIKEILARFFLNW